MVRSDSSWCLYYQSTRQVVCEERFFSLGLQLASKFLWSRRILEDKLLSVIGRFLWLKAFESICGFKNRPVVRSKHSWSLYLQGRIEYVVGLRWDILIENRQRGRMSLLWLLWSAKHPIHVSSLGDCLSTILPV